MWENMFGLEVSILEKIVRPVIVYVFLLVGLRLAGKRELAQLNAMDLIVLLTLANTVQNSIIGRDDSLTGGLIGAASLLLINYAAVRFLFGHPQVDRWVEGSPVKLIENGQLCRDRMQRELITRAELTAAAHKQGFATLKHVSEAVLEPTGVISFMGKDPAPNQLRHEELMHRLDEMAGQLADLKNALAARG